MIKISQDNLFFWKYFFGGGFLVIHFTFLLFITFIVNVWFVYLLYLFFAALQFLVHKAWRYLFIKNAYLTNDFKKIIFKNQKDADQEFYCTQIINVSTNSGITKVEIMSDDVKKTFYFMINSKENLKYLKNG